MRKAWLLWSKPPCPAIAGVERVLPRMPEGGVAEVVAKRDGFGKVVVELESARERTRDLRHLDRMGEAGAEMIALVIDEHLGLVGEAAEGGRMDDAVAVALEFGPRRRRRLGNQARRARRGRRRRARAPSGLSRPPSIALTLRSLPGVHILDPAEF